MTKAASVERARARKREKRRFQKLDKKKTRDRLLCKSDSLLTRVHRAMRRSRLGAAARLAREERRGRETHPDGGTPMEVPRGELAGVVDLCDVAGGRKGWVRRGGARASPRRSRRAFGDAETFARGQNRAAVP